MTDSDRSRIDIFQEMVSHTKQIILLDALEEVIQATKVKAMADYASAVHSSNRNRRSCRE